MFRHWMIAVMCLLGLAPCAVVAGTPPPKIKPEIFSISPAEGPAGTVIKVGGAGFERTRCVLFSAGRTGWQAKFKVLSDRELEVIAPPYFRSGTSATLAVVTAAGATVGVPASVLDVDGTRRSAGGTATFYHVLEGGSLNSAHGIVLVDGGGVASAPESAALCFIKNGGTLLNADHFSGIVIYEPKALLQATARPKGHSTWLMRVPEISASIGIEPFIYYRPDGPEAPADAAPVVRSVSPRRVPAGAILTLHGTGFLETNEVSFLSERGGGKPLTAGFRIVSDRELEVETPELLSGSPPLVVVNPKGGTLVLSPDRPAPAAGPKRNAGRSHRNQPPARALWKPLPAVDVHPMVAAGSMSRSVLSSPFEIGRP